MKAFDLKPETANSKLELGVSLVELIVSIVVIGISVAGILLALNTTLRGSGDPLVEKQALAIAEAFLEEVELMPFTYCDPDDPNAATATSAAGCTGGAGGPNDESKLPLGPEAGEARSSATSPFDNVSDYNGYDTNNEVPSGIKDITGTAIPGLGAYRAVITVAQQSIPLVGAVPAIPAADSLLITVTVTGPANTSVSLHGYRTRYAPNALP